LINENIVTFIKEKKEIEANSQGNAEFQIIARHEELINDVFRNIERNINSNNNSRNKKDIMPSLLTFLNVDFIINEPVDVNEEINLNDNSPKGIRSLLTTYLQLCISKSFIKAQEEGCYYIPFLSNSDNKNNSPDKIKLHESETKNENKISGKTQVRKLIEDTEINKIIVQEAPSDNNHEETMIDNLNSTRQLNGDKLSDNIINNDNYKNEKDNNKQDINKRDIELKNIHHGNYNISNIKIHFNFRQTH